MNAALVALLLVHLPPVDEGTRDPSLVAFRQDNGVWRLVYFLAGD